MTLKVKSLQLISKNIIIFNERHSFYRHIRFTIKDYHLRSTFHADIYWYISRIEARRTACIPDSLEGVLPLGQVAMLPRGNEINQMIWKVSKKRIRIVCKNKTGGAPKHLK